LNINIGDDLRIGQYGLDDIMLSGTGRNPRLLVLALIAFTASPLHAAESATWGPSNGTTVVVDAQDQNGVRQTVASLSGSKGLLIFFNRSADW
jgi:hypothetical protein